MSDLKAFQALPKARREQLRQLDRALNQADPATQQRLGSVLERYYLWLEKLPEADRKRLEAATSKSERLKIVREISDRQWVDRLPQHDRDAVLKLPADRRGTEIARLRRDERQRRLAWQKAFRQPRVLAKVDGPRPAHLADFPAEVQTFVNEQLIPMLTVQGKAALEKAEGHWPGLALTILELADRHPVLPPQGTRSGVTRFQDLPPHVRGQLPYKRLVNLGQWQTLHRTEGRWPDFALTYTDLARRDGKVLPYQLGACRPRQFSPAVQQFLENKLEPALTSADKARLKEVEGKWPEYPRLLHELAHAHNLTIPGLSLPGPHEIWLAARSVLPDVPDRVLHDFAVAELTEVERTRLNLSITDPASRDRIKQAYFKKHPNELRRYRRLAIERAD